jgi:hypothetical protein
MNSKRLLVRTTPNHAFESGRAVKRRAAQRERLGGQRTLPDVTCPAIAVGGVRWRGVVG